MRYGLRRVTRDVNYFLDYLSLIIMPEQHTTRAPLDSKPRGANRSTKVAGKLKVLPEQPEHLPILGAKTPITKPTRDNSESVGTTGDSEDGDIEESEEDVEVCRYILSSSSILILTYSGVQSNFPYTGRSGS